MVGFWAWVWVLENVAVIVFAHRFSDNRIYQ
jgi:hypothetical protein